MCIINSGPILEQEKMSSLMLKQGMAYRFPYILTLFEVWVRPRNINCLFIVQKFLILALLPRCGDPKCLALPCSGR